MAHCFTYGSLMCRDIMSVVCGAEPRSVPALIEGFRRHRVVDESYPGLAPAAGHVVRGLLYLDLPDPAWPCLDRFEGAEYERQRLVVRLDDGRREQAWVYVFRPDLAHRLIAEDWDFEHFLKNGKARFVRQYLDPGGADSG